MKPITEYKDYRLYIQDYYDERKRLGAFSWREFCKSAGFSSPNFLKLVCLGESRLGTPKIENVANAMGLVGYEKDYFAGTRAGMCGQDAAAISKKKLTQIEEVHR